ncbi:Transcription factor MAMYB [Sesamum alatum]|uniref:Transcription factor MAMYB n=1 Tax=Sesamum alatum TaxID=300844 RepID=A0AAE2CFK7_9LAMI|nr:Transcription factor MAMYB [Sesamum alatum]
MEFLDEFESRPRFLLQSKHSPQPSDPDHSSSSSSSFLSSLHKPTLFISLSFSLLIFSLAFFYFNFEPLKSLLSWISFSLLLGPFAPPSLTAGDIRVGLGPPLKESPTIAIETTEKFNRKSMKTRKKPSEEAVRSDGVLEKSTTTNGPLVDLADNESNRFDESLSENKSVEQSEWSEVDEDLLRKLMGKHPVGKPGRWEAIAEGFKGKHKVEAVIRKAKEMGERKVSDQDSYSKFLKDRKPVDKRLLDNGGNEANAEIGIENQNVEEGRKESTWSAAEDLALLNALKVFPKDVAMRWEKIAASVPGKAKSACMKRVTELKKDFRSSKASSGQIS